MLAVMNDVPPSTTSGLRPMGEGRSVVRAEDERAAGGADELLPLVERARTGDRGALEALLRRLAPYVATVCRHLVGGDARDAAQESLERIVRELARFDANKGRFKPWATMVARNVCRDRLRRRGLERRAFVDDGDEVALDAPGGDGDPERIAIAKQGTERLSAALTTLPAPMREAVVMFHVGEASYEEIARALDVPLGTVMTWLHRGRQRLRAAIEEP